MTFWFIVAAGLVFLVIAVRRMAAAIEQRNGEHAATAIVLFVFAMWALFLLVSQR